MSSPYIATYCKCPEGVTMKALPACNYSVSLRLSYFKKILAGKLECRFDRLGSS